MPCLAALFALIAPRVVAALLWFFTDWFEGVYDGLLIPLLGFIFLPVTLLWYSVVVNYFGGEWTLVPIVGVVIALLMDLSPATGRRD